LVTADEILARLEPWRARQRRQAWTPRVVEDEGAAASRFGGVPWLAAGEDWPRCGDCARPLPFFLQLDLASVPTALDRRFGEGLLQLFYCTECDGGFEAFARSHRVRVLRGAAAPATAVPGEVELFPVRAIVGWEEMADLPDPAEHEDLEIGYSYDFAARIARVDCPEVGLSAELPFDEGGDALAETVATAATGDKLAGWPSWVQNVEYPTCPRCQERMRYVFQLDSEDNVPYMWGDAGTGHITQCPQHLDVVTFTWACH
jgi:hypothetical protein